MVAPDEFAAVGGRVGVDDHSPLVDGDMMMKPTQADQVVGMMITPMLAFQDVVGLDPVTALSPNGSWGRGRRRKEADKGAP
ncbi:MAG: hypothetical protein ACR2ME_09140 [Acidimicrobiia bacterium]